MIRSSGRPQPSPVPAENPPYGHLYQRQMANMMTMPFLEVEEALACPLVSAIGHPMAVRIPPDFNVEQSESFQLNDLAGTVNLIFCPTRSGRFQARVFADDSSTWRVIRGFTPDHVLRLVRGDADAVHFQLTGMARSFPPEGSSMGPAMSAEGSWYTCSIAWRPRHRGKRISGTIKFFDLPLEAVFTSTTNATFLKGTGFESVKWDRCQKGLIFGTSDAEVGLDPNSCSQGFTVRVLRPSNWRSDKDIWYKAHRVLSTEVGGAGSQEMSIPYNSPILSRPDVTSLQRPSQYNAAIIMPYSRSDPSEWLQIELGFRLGMPLEMDACFVVGNKVVDPAQTAPPPSPMFALEDEASRSSAAANWNRRRRSGSVHSNGGSPSDQNGYPSSIKTESCLANLLNPNASDPHHSAGLTLPPGFTMASAAAVMANLATNMQLMNGAVGDHHRGGAGQQRVIPPTLGGTVDSASVTAALTAAMLNQAASFRQQASPTGGHNNHHHAPTTLPPLGNNVMSSSDTGAGAATRKKRVHQVPEEEEDDDDVSSRASGPAKKRKDSDNRSSADEDDEEFPDDGTSPTNAKYVMNTVPSQTVDTTLPLKDNIRLSLEQIEFFHQYGYIVLHNVVNPAVFLAWRECILSVVNARGSRKFAHPGRDRQNFPSKARERHFSTVLRHHLQLGLTSPRIMAYIKAACKVLGPWACQLYPQVPRYRYYCDQSHIKQAYSNATPFHVEDSFWAFFSHMIVNFWLALEDCTESNGCLCVIPGSHRIVGEKLRSTGTLPEGSVTSNNLADFFDVHPELRTLHCMTMPLPAGSCVLYHGHLAIGDMCNMTNHRRAAFLLNLMPDQMVYNGRQNCLDAKQAANYQPGVTILDDENYFPLLYTNPHPSASEAPAASSRSWKTTQKTTFSPGTSVIPSTSQPLPGGSRQFSFVTPPHPSQAGDDDDEEFDDDTVSITDSNKTREPPEDEPPRLGMAGIRAMETAISSRICLL